MASSTWRITGIDTYGSDLILSTLALYQGAVDVSVGAVVTASHAPTEGSLADLTDASEATSCRFSAEDVSAPGFWIQFQLSADADVWCARFSSPSAQGFMHQYALGAVVAGRWEWAQHGWVNFPGAGQLSVLTTGPVEIGSPVGWSTTFAPEADNAGYDAIAMSADGMRLITGGYGTSNAKASLSTDGGNTWQALTGPVAGPTGFRGGAMSADGQVIAVAGYGSSAGRVSLSTDGGQTWSIAGAIQGNGGFSAVDMSGDGSVIVACGNGSSWSPISISRDSGATWAWIEAAPYTGLNNIAISTDGLTIVATGSRVSISKDGGVTWAFDDTPARGPTGFDAVAVSADGNTIAVGGYGGAGCRVSVTKNGGQTWTTVQTLVPVANSSGFTGLAVSADGAKLVATTYGSNAERVSYSADSGTTWATELGPNGGTLGFRSIAMSAAGNKFAVYPYSSWGPVSICRRRDGAYVDAPLQVAKPVSLVAVQGVTAPAQGVVPIFVAEGTAVRDVEFGGAFKVYGTVARKNTPTNVPLRRRVRLHRSRDGMLVRETWSENDGAYEFLHISGQYEYDVIAWDHQMSYRSVVANNLTPEAM